MNLGIHGIQCNLVKILNLYLPPLTKKVLQDSSFLLDLEHLLKRQIFECHMVRYRHEVIELRLKQAARHSRTCASAKLII